MFQNFKKQNRRFGAMEAEAVNNPASPKSHAGRRHKRQILFICFFTCCFSVINSFAQDIITLKTGADIQALVQEIGEVDVKFKRLDNPNGPSYSLRKSEIIMIRYANGSRDVFEENIVSQPEVTDERNFQNRDRFQQNVATDYTAFTQLRRNDAAMDHFLRQNDDALYRQFHKGVKLRRTGKALFGPGLGLSIGGLGLLIAGSIWYEDAKDYDEKSDAQDMIDIGGAALVVGQALIIVSIPLSASGGGMKRRAANGYEEKYFKNRTGYQPALDINFNGNGVGLALRF